jgi:PhzF family phenazine biosynthesis protein
VLDTLGEGEEARFSTRSGLLTANKHGGWIELNFPGKPSEETLPPEGLLEALEVNALYVGKNKFDYIVEVENESIVRNLNPNFTLLGTLPVRGVLVTSVSGTDEFDFVSRFFAPKVGVNEDPVTGSAHCCLGPYWAGRLGRSEFTAYQASPRGGLLKVKVEGSRVLLSGQAVTVISGSLQA